MHTLRTPAAVGLVTVALLVLACEHEQPALAPPAHAPASAPVGVSDAPRGGSANAQPRSTPDESSVVERLARARCERERFCDNVGRGKKFDSAATCLDTFRSRIGDALSSYECPGGLDDVAVEQCLAAISSEECSVHPEEVMMRMNRCRKGEICVKR
jgi:hypothetical protein